MFVPFTSKKAVASRVRATLAEIEDAVVEVRVHSKIIRAQLRVDAAAIQIEANVDTACPSMAVPTASFALRQGQPSRLVRVIAPDRALASKLAAWNERRLLRDLYDVYCLVVRLGAVSDVQELQRRLRHIDSRLPVLRRRKTMTMEQFVDELRGAGAAIDDVAVRNELAPVLPADEVEGLVPRLRGGTQKVIELLERAL